MDKIKIVVAHPYQQHSYKTAEAINNMGLLYKYITTVYDKRLSLTHLSKLFLKGDNFKRANSRKSLLSNSQIKQFCELENLFILLLYRIDKKRILYNKFNNYMIKKFNNKLYRYVCKNKINYVVVYDTVSWKFIEKLKLNKKDVKVILDMSAPNAHYMDRFFKKSIDENFSESTILRNEIDSYLYKKNLENVNLEISNSDYFLVASEFTKNSLIYSNVNIDNIYICRYGINIDEDLNEKKSLNEKIKCLFLGNVTQKKGFIDYVKAIEQLEYDNYEYHIIGKYTDDDPLYASYKDKCIFYNHITHDKVLEICSLIDIIIFPSLSDGFGFSVLEAMSKKVVPIVSKNVGISDIISEGINGFLFDVGDVNKIVTSCKYLLDNRNKMYLLQEKAYETAKNMTWSNYNQAIKDTFNNIVQKDYINDNKI